MNSGFLIVVILLSIVFVFCYSANCLFYPEDRRILKKIILPIIIINMFCYHVLDRLFILHKFNTDNNHYSETDYNVELINGKSAINTLDYGTIYLNDNKYYCNNKLYYEIGSQVTMRTFYTTRYMFFYFKPQNKIEIKESF